MVNHGFLEYISVHTDVIEFSSWLILFPNKASVAYQRKSSMSYHGTITVFHSHIAMNFETQDIGNSWRQKNLGEGPMNNMCSVKSRMRLSEQQQPKGSPVSTIYSVHSCTMQWQF